jgi:hypothetical protein
MLEILGSALAVKAVEFLLLKPAEGALQSIGSDVYKSTFDRFKGFFAYKFSGRTEFQHAETKPQDLIKAVEQEILSNRDFEKELSSLVSDLQRVIEVGNDSSTTNTSQRDNGISISDSDLRNVDMSTDSSKSADDSSVLIDGNNSGNISISAPARDSFRI